jgi:MFS family permease
MELTPLVTSRPRRAARATTDTVRTHAHRTFSSLKVRNYRLYFIGQTISLCGSWMQAVAQALLVVYHLHGTGTALGLVVGLQFAPVLFLAPYGGVLAERFSKRRLLFITQSVAGVLALTLGVLVAADLVRMWMVYVLAFGLGVVNAIDNPVRQTFVHELVGRTQLANAVMLNSIIVNLSRVIGPAIAGVIAAQFGLGPCFIINGVSFGAVLACLYLMDPGKLVKSKAVPAAKGQLRAGFAYAWKTPVIRDVLIIMVLVGTLSFEFGVSLPLLARTTFHGAEAMVALLMSAMGVGAVLGGLVTAGKNTATMRALGAGTLGFGTAILLVAVAPSVAWAAAGMAVVGYFSVSFTALTNTILQMSAAARMRGRVMALWAMAFLGSGVFGGPAIGWIGEFAGPRWSLAVGGLAAAAAGAFGLVAARARARDAGEPGALCPVVEESA